jgi:hypothetical protein
MSNTVDVAGAGVGALLLIGQVMEALVAKKILTQAECAALVTAAAKHATGDISAPVMDAYKKAFPGLNI